MALKLTNQAESGRTVSYEQLSDLPSLNGVTLKGNRDVAENVITFEEIDLVWAQERKEESHGSEL